MNLKTPKKGDTINSVEVYQESPSQGQVCWGPMERRYFGC